MSSPLYDLIIIGGGPAGAAAGIYAARKRLKSLLIAGSFTGQSAVSAEIQNWIGTVVISGEKLVENLRTHVKAYADDVLAVHEGEFAKSIRKEDDLFTLTTDKGSYTARALLIATGSHRKKVTVPGAEKYEHKGITYCASCDGPLFTGMDVVVIGGGNAGFETASQLLAYANSVTLVHRSDTFRADPITVEKLCCDPKMRVIKNADILEFKGNAMLTSLTYKDKTTGETHELPVQGVFVEVGQMPNTEFTKEVVPMTDDGHIIIDQRTQKTKTHGIWSAGDCTDVLYHQNNIAVGDAVRAVEDIFIALRTK